MGIGNIIAKTVGLAGLGLVAYDSHVGGKIEADAYQKRTTADSMADSYVNSMSMDRASIVQSKAKKGWHNVKMDDNFFPAMQSLVGYVKGFGSLLVSNVVPFALATATLLTKGKTSKACALGLGAWAAFSFATDIMGFGKTSKLNSNF